MPDQISYDQLDPATQLQLVRTRLRDLETAHMQLSLRINSPAPGDNITQQDRDNLQQLTNSIGDLQTMEKQLGGSSGSGE